MKTEVSGAAGRAYSQYQGTSEQSYTGLISYTLMPY